MKSNSLSVFSQKGESQTAISANISLQHENPIVFLFFLNKPIASMHNSQAILQESNLFHPFTAPGFSKRQGYVVVGVWDFVSRQKIGVRVGGDGVNKIVGSERKICERCINVLLFSLFAFFVSEL